MKEPSVSIQMTVRDLANTVISGQNIAAGTIIADCGPITPQIYNSSTTVLQAYTPSGKITRDIDPTVVHAAAIADIMPVFINRVYKDNGVRGGIVVKSTGIPAAQTFKDDQPCTSAGEETTVEGAEMYIIATSPSTANFTASLSKHTDDEKMIDLTVVTPSRTYEYTGSLDPDYVNSYGANQYIENINDYDNIPFHVYVVGTGNPIAFTNVNFGAVEKSEGAIELTDRKATVDKLMEDDEIKPAFLCPFGYTNAGYLQYLVSYGPKNHVFVPIGLMVDKNDAEVIKAACPTLTSDYAIVMAPYDKSTSMTDYAYPMSLEVAYLRKIESNKAKRCEFAPMMGKTNSSMDITKLSVKLTKSTREALLDKNIMSIVSRKSDSSLYLNKNVCSGGHNTILSEDQNIRLACKINRDLDELLEPILGKFNTQETRSRVTTTIKNYFNDNILNQVYSIDSYTIVCDDSNNPAYIRANGQLVVDVSVTYLNTIYQVLVYHKALDVNSNAE